MDENQNHPPKQEKSGKKLQLDLSEAIAQGFDDDDDEIIELKDEITPPSREKEAEIDLAAKLDEDDAQSDLPAAEKIIDLDALDDQSGELQDVASLADELAFEEEDEDEDRTPIFEEEPVIDTDPRDDEAEEVTDFDDILSEDTNEMMTLSEISEELEPEEEEEEEYLELFDVEEESEVEPEKIEEEIIQFNDPEAEVEDVELKDFIDDSLDEEIQIIDDSEDDVTGTLGVEAGTEINLSQKASAEEEFDFNMDAKEISEKIDRLDTIFFDDTDEEAESDETAEFDLEATGASESDIGDDSDEIEIEDVDVGGRKSSDAPPVFGGTAAPDVDHDRMEKTIERIIEQKFSGKIESMITQIIEKAVSKEIKRLKRILLEDDSDEDL